MHDQGGRKYLGVVIDGEFVSLKVPFRYNRVMCNVGGIKTIQEYEKGDVVLLEYEKKRWNETVHFVLSTLRPAV
jgi:hypothetical protein